MGLPRSLEPEWLDLLPPDAPRAVRSRKDLRLINRLMFQAAIMKRLIRKAGGRPVRRIVELGGGDGSFMLGVAASLAKSMSPANLVVVDRQDIVSDATRRGFERLGWRITVAQSDVFAFLEQAVETDSDLVAANLFLHHFSDDALKVMFALIAARRAAFVACEPERDRPSLFASRLLFAIGANDVTRHDAVASVRAGFRDTELSALWPAPGDWHVREGKKRPFTHVFAAWPR